MAGSAAAALNGLLLLYGFPEATMHSPGRETTTTPLQQLFVMNSPFMRDQAAALAASVAKEPDANAKIRAMYRKVLARDPSEHELVLASRVPRHRHDDGLCPRITLHQ